MTEAISHRHALVSRGEAGLACDAEGVALGPICLVCVVKGMTFGPRLHCATSN